MKPFDVMQQAFEFANAKDWRRARDLCASCQLEPPPVGAVARLNLLICQYHLGHAKLVPRSAFALLPSLPAPAQLACAGLILLAAHADGTIQSFKHVALAISGSQYSPLDLPTVPSFVLLQPDMKNCLVQEGADVGPMISAIDALLAPSDLPDEARLALVSLAERYRHRAALMLQSAAVAPSVEAKTG